MATTAGEAPAGDGDTVAPNLLFVMTDQHRWDALGCAGGWVETPHLDRIAAEGVRFPHAYTNSPVCVPARVSLATGRYPHDHGVWRNGSYTLPPEHPTWMAGVREAGYATSVFGKTHLHPHGGDLRDRAHLLQAYGFDHVDEIAGPRASVNCRSNLTDRWEEAGLWEAYRHDMRERFRTKAWEARPSVLPLELYADTYVGQQAASYLRSYRGDKPWFCWVSFGGPHEPWDAPEPYASRYRPEDMPAPLQFRDLAGGKRAEGLLDKRVRAGHGLSASEIASLRANYAGNVTLIDDQVGEILRAVEERGELERTVVVLSSDHGELNGDYGLIYKQTFLNGAVRVPLLVRVPPALGPYLQGHVSEAVVELMDVGPTLAELAGADVPETSHARSLLPSLRKAHKPHRRAALSEYRGELMVATSEWKAAVNRLGRPYLLFDLAGDPDETRNLAGRAEYAEAQERMRLLLLERLVATLPEGFGK